MSTITVQQLTKHFGPVTAVSDLSFEVAGGTVTGFIGPNGAGKTTTLRALLGLVRPTAGSALIDGRPFAALPEPARHVGAVLESASFHPGRTAVDHLRVLATTASLPRSRVDDVLALVELEADADRRVGGYSLGMRQRLGLAAALIGDPPVLVLDEPANGLDPEGIRWLRSFLRARATAGGTVLVSSHQLAELALSADHVVVVKDDRLVTQGPVDELTAAAAVVVRTAEAATLVDVLRARGIDAERTGADEVRAHATSTDAVGRAVAEAGIVVYEMRLERRDLETAFLNLTTTIGA